MNISPMDKFNIYWKNREGKTSFYCIVVSKIKRENGAHEIKKAYLPVIISNNAKKTILCICKKNHWNSSATVKLVDAWLTCKGTKVAIFVNKVEEVQVETVSVPLSQEDSFSQLLKSPEVECVPEGQELDNCLPF